MVCQSSHKTVVQKREDSVEHELWYGERDFMRKFQSPVKGKSFSTYLVMNITITFFFFKHPFCFFFPGNKTFGW